MTEITTNHEFKTGAELLAFWGRQTREQKLERAVIALMDQLDQLHGEYKKQSLSDNIGNVEMYCSCADAYRMGHEALKEDFLDQLRELANAKVGDPLPSFMSGINNWGVVLSKIADRAVKEIESLRESTRQHFK